MAENNVERARVALGSRAQITLGDVRTADFGSADGIVILDVLHYIAYPEQLSILARVREALRVADGILLLRIGNALGGAKFVWSTWVDRMVLLARGQGVATITLPLHETMARGAVDDRLRQRDAADEFGDAVRQHADRRKTPMKPLLLENFTASSCIGLGIDQMLGSILAQRSGLKSCAFETVDIDTHIGEVPGVDDVRLPVEFARYDCRNNRLAELALRQDGFRESMRRAAARWDRRRIGVFIGTSTAGILQTELAYRERDLVTGALPAHFEYSATHNSFSVADYLRQRLQFEGPAVAISCACASSAKVFSSARRMIEANVIDAALVGGGVDSLCLTTLYGFHSLQLSSPRPCRPFDIARDGISIGEAAAFALLERAPRHLTGDEILLLGVGESSDAYHMSRAASRGSGRAPRDAGSARIGRSRCGPDRLHQLARHRHSQQRSIREPGRHQRLRSHHTREFDQRSNRPHSRCGRCARSGHQRHRIAQRSDAGGHSHHPHRSHPHCVITSGRIAARPSPVFLSNSFGFGGTNCSLIFGRPG